MEDTIKQNRKKSSLEIVTYVSQTINQEFEQNDKHYGFRLSKN